MVVVVLFWGGTPLGTTVVELRQKGSVVPALGGGEGLEFGHFRQSFILKGCDHLAQGCAPRATLGVCRVWESTLKGVASVFSFTVVNRTLVEKTVCTRILASGCGIETDRDI